MTISLDSGGAREGKGGLALGRGKAGTASWGEGRGVFTFSQDLSSSCCCSLDRVAMLTSWPEGSSTLRSRHRESSSFPACQPLKGGWPTGMLLWWQSR